MAKLGPSKHTKAERVLRMLLVRHGLRHQSQVKWGPINRWSADFCVMGVMIDVHGFYWHHKNSRMRAMSEFWQRKLKTNRKRDAEKVAYAASNGIRYLVLWDYEILSKDVRDKLLDEKIIGQIEFVKKFGLPRASS